MEIPEIINKVKEQINLHQEYVDNPKKKDNKWKKATRTLMYLQQSLQSLKRC